MLLLLVMVTVTAIEIDIGLGTELRLIDRYKFAVKVIDIKQLNLQFECKRLILAVPLQNLGGKQRVQRHIVQFIVSQLAIRVIIKMVCVFAKQTHSQVDLGHIIRFVIEVDATSKQIVFGLVLTLKVKLESIAFVVDIDDIFWRGDPLILFAAIKQQSKL